MGRYRFAICLGIVVIGSWVIFSVTKDKDIFQEQDTFQVQREQDSITGEKKVISLEELGRGSDNGSCREEYLYRYDTKRSCLWGSRRVFNF